MRAISNIAQRITSAIGLNKKAWWVWMLFGVVETTSIQQGHVADALLLPTFFGAAILFNYIRLYMDRRDAARRAYVDELLRAADAYLDAHKQAPVKQPVANREDLRQAYRRVAKLCHPDRVPKQYARRATLLFQRLNTANANKNLALMLAIEKECEMTLVNG